MAKFTHLHIPKSKTHGTAEFYCNTLIVSLLQSSFFTDGTTGGTIEFLCNILLFNALRNRFFSDGTTGRKNPKYGGTAEFHCNILLFNVLHTSLSVDGTTGGTTETQKTVLLNSVVISCRSML